MWCWNQYKPINYRNKETESSSCRRGDKKQEDNVCCGNSMGGTAEMSTETSSVQSRPARRKHLLSPSGQTLSWPNSFLAKHGRRWGGVAWRLLFGRTWQEGGWGEGERKCVNFFQSDFWQMCECFVIFERCLKFFQSNLWRWTSLPPTLRYPLLLQTALPGFYVNC